MATAPTKEQLQNAIGVEIDAWIIMESSYEYNDEYNYITEGGEPVKVFLDKAEAEAEKDRLQKEWAEDADPEDWDDDELPDMFDVYPIKVKAGA